MPMVSFVVKSELFHQVCQVVPNLLQIPFLNLAASLSDLAAAFFNMAFSIDRYI
jgi:hypothetical protein